MLVPRLAAPRRSRGVLGPSLAENRPKTDPQISGQTAFGYPVKHYRHALLRRGHLLTPLMSRGSTVLPWNLLANGWPTNSRVKFALQSIGCFLSGSPSGARRFDRLPGICFIANLAHNFTGYFAKQSIGCSLSWVSSGAQWLNRLLGIGLTAHLRTKGPTQIPG